MVADRCIQEIFNHSKRRNNRNGHVKKIHRGNNKFNKPKKFKKIEQNVYIIEGIRSPQEVQYFRRRFKNFKIIAIHSNPQERFNRLIRRKRSDDSPDYKVVLERDNRELNFGIGNVIARADYMLINEGHIQNFKNSVRMLIQHEIKPRNNHPRSQGKNKGKGKSNRRPIKGRKQHHKHSERKTYHKSNRR